MGLTGPPRRESLAEQVSKLRRSCAVKEAEVAKAKDDERPFGMKGWCDGMGLLNQGQSWKGNQLTGNSWLQSKDYIYIYRRFDFFFEDLSLWIGTILVHGSGSSVIARPLHWKPLSLFVARDFPIFSPPGSCAFSTFYGFFVSDCWCLANQRCSPGLNTSVIVCHWGRPPWSLQRRWG